MKMSDIIFLFSLIYFFLQARRQLSDQDFHHVTEHMRHDVQTALDNYVASNTREEAVRATESIEISKARQLVQVKLFKL